MKSIKKIHFNITFLTLILLLIFIFIYSGLEIVETRTETMHWKSATFILYDFTKVIGILLIIILATYIFLKKKYYSGIDTK